MRPALRASLLAPQHRLPSVPVHSPEVMRHCNMKGLERGLFAPTYCAVQQERFPVAKIAPAPSSTPGFKLPELKLPKFDLDALFAVQKANLATAHEAQTVLADAFLAIAKVQQGRVEEAVAAARAALESRKLTDPQAVLAEVKAAVEKNVAVSKEVVDLAVAAQRRVVELFTQRTQANVEDAKALAAA